MTSLHQIIAVRPGVSNRAIKDTTAIYRIFSVPSLFDGLEKTYASTIEGGKQYPSETQRVQARVSDQLNDVSAALSRLFDVQYSLEAGNTTARADLKVDGDVLLPSVPVTYLLFLDRQCKNLLEVIRSLPVPDPAVAWHYDDATGLQATAPSVKVRTDKLPEVITKSPATDKHPAQTEILYLDKPTGDWTTIKYSGAISQPKKAELTARITLLIEAVKIARQEANKVEVPDFHVADKIFGYLFP